MKIGDYAVVTKLMSNDEYAGVRVDDIIMINSYDGGLYNCVFQHKLEQVEDLNPDGSYAMREEQLMKIEFHPGDIVRHRIYGIGTIRHVDHSAFYAVEFQSSRDGFHSCDGYCSDGKGHYCLERTLELIKRGEKEMEKSTTENVKKRMRQSDIIHKKMIEVGKSTGINIKEIEEVQPDKIYILHQDDGSKIKTVCHNGDVFSRETAAMIMVAKADLGGSKYNNRVKKLLKYWSLQDKYKEQLKKEEASYRKKQQKWAEHKREAEKRAKESRIEEQKEAYIRAIKELGIDTATLVPDEIKFIPDENRG